MSPCRDCEFKHYSKAVPYIWFEEKKRNAKNRTPRHIPGENMKNPCWCCESAIDYSDAVSESMVGPPSSWPDGVTEYPDYQAAEYGMRIF